MIAFYANFRISWSKTYKNNSDTTSYHIEVHPQNLRCFFFNPANQLKLCKHVLRSLYRIRIDTTCSVHYNDVIMGAIASQITSLTIVYSIVYSDADQRKHQSSASPAFVRGIHRGPVDSPHKWPVTRKMFPFDDVITRKPTRPLYHSLLLLLPHSRMNVDLLFPDSKDPR